MYKGYIYRHWHVNEDDIEKNYIGQVYNRTPQQRWGRNGKGYTRARKKDGSLTEFANAIEKHGWDNFNHEILLTIECETLEELVFWLDQWEKYYIEKYDSFYNGYNGDTGGRNGYIVSEETVQKQSEAKTEMWANMSEEEKKQFSEKCSRAQTERFANMSEEEKKQWSEKISEANKQVWANKSEEEKKQWSEAHKGDKNSNATKVICLETEQVFTTIKEAQEWVGAKSHTGISNCCQGNRKSAGKHPITGKPLHWMYYKDYLKLQNELNELN